LETHRIGNSAKYDEFVELENAQEDAMRVLMHSNVKILSSTEALKKTSDALAETQDSEIFQIEVLRQQEDISRMSTVRKQERQSFLIVAPNLQRRKRNLSQKVM
jgi:hypothetical protein